MSCASPLRSKGCRSTAIALNADCRGTCGPANDGHREHVQERKKSFDRLTLSRQIILAASCRLKKRTIALALCCFVVCSPVYAKTFVGVLYPLFGPVAAIGLVELVAELKSMPDVEVATYLHQSWPILVDDINRQPRGTHILVIGYSLGANNSVLVANETNHYVDSIIALQPSVFTSNPSVTGKVGRMIEIYNPNPWMTFGGMGSQKLTGANIEYVVNNDTHPGAQFSSEFRSLVKSEVTRLAAEDGLDKARAKVPTPTQRLKLLQPPKLEVAKEQQSEHAPRSRTASVDDLSNSVNSGRRLTIADVENYAARTYRTLRTADALSSPVNSGTLFVRRPLTVADMEDYAERSYQSSAEAPSTTVNAGPLFVQRPLTIADMVGYAERTHQSLPQTNNGH